MGENQILENKMQEAYDKAIDSLARYKFEMFGYWSSSWVKYNQLWGEFGNKKKPNPFKNLVQGAKSQQIKDQGVKQCLTIY
tara:strand:- start:82 stop:324 length:243 start_codon:yes stop_codon:yes gene_type:complete